MSRCENGYALKRGTSQPVTVRRLKEKKKSKFQRVHRVVKTNGPSLLPRFQPDLFLFPLSLPFRPPSSPTRGSGLGFLQKLSPRGSAICGLCSDPFSTAQEAKDLGLSEGVRWKELRRRSSGRASERLTGPTG